MTQQQWGQPGGQFGRTSPTWGRPATAPGWGNPPGRPGSFPTAPAPAGGGSWQQPPAGRPRSNPLKKVLAAVIGLVALALVSLIIVNLVSNSDQVAYQNDDYQVPAPDKNPPPLPAPETKSQAVDWTQHNKLYDQTMPVPIRCELDPITAASTDAELQTHLNKLVACLMRAWEPPVTAAGYQLVRPSVTIYGDAIETKCGKAGGGNAFYCPADQQIYYSRTLPDAIADLQDSPWGPDIVMAHEFGHAVQARTGILISANGLEQLAGDDTEEGLEMSRRVEVQADCFSGLFLQASSRSLGMQQSDVDAIETIYVAIGDDTLSGNPDIEATHGHGDTRLYWGRQGMADPHIKVCDTFTAPSDQVK
ncbi:hypothetical protein FOE78_21815 [Microlunatus elymi]|uniref:Neutral zinc metallopeptidase n=1 Tax=Microlunatus elymi TaxID=2596828 RepID=A0A516Q411_9ACTN|nr:neutral zinc metallopeptidase [Microlunatus elymi]QDP98186.1 hypothetical protein FOE78_21815 [Microlunatus elymi]